jgi:hypothetical protein
MEQGPEGWLFFQMRGTLAQYEPVKSGAVLVLRADMEARDGSEAGERCVGGWHPQPTGLM